MYIQERILGPSYLARVAFGLDFKEGVL